MWKRRRRRSRRRRRRRTRTRTRTRTRRTAIIKQAEIYNVLTNLETLGSFATSGEVDAADTPQVSVEGVGRIGWPLCKEQGASLISKMEQAPFGKGLDTVVDTEVK
jgi:hypothetical protein